MRKGAKSDYLTALISLVTPEVSQPSSLPASNLRSVFLVDAIYGICLQISVPRR